MTEVTSWDLYLQAQSEAMKVMGAVANEAIQDSATGNQTRVSSQQVFEEAQSFDYYSGTRYNVSSPQMFLNSEQTMLTAKTLNTQVFHQQESNVNRFIRAQNFLALEAANHYRYCTNQDLTAADRILEQAGRSFKYGDYVKIQAGMPNQQAVAIDGRDEDYGNIDMGAVNNITLAAVNGGVLLDGKSYTSIFSKGDVLINSSQRAAIMSRYGMGFSTKGEMSLNSTYGMLIHTDGVMDLSAKVLNINSEFIHIGPVSAIKRSLNLDTLFLLTEVATSVVSGNFLPTFSIPASISNFASSNFLSGIPSLSQLGSGLLGTATSTAFNMSTKTIGSLFSGFTSKTLLSSIGGQGLAAMAQGVGDYLGGSSAGSLATSFLNSAVRQIPGVESIPALAQVPGLSTLMGLGSIPGINNIPGLSQLGSIFGTYAGKGFDFDIYPRLETIKDYITVPTTEPVQNPEADGKVYRAFPFPSAPDQ